MKKLFFFSFLLITTHFLYAQNYSGCEWIQCKYCKLKILRRAYNMQNSCPEIENGRNMGHIWISLGAYDTECNAQSLKADKEWEAKKEKVKNGQTVIEWHNNAKACITQAGNNYYQYDEYGVMERKLENGLLTIFNEGKIIKGGGVKVDYNNRILLEKNGEWIEDGYKVIYKNGYVEYDEKKEILKVKEQENARIIEEQKRLDAIKETKLQKLKNKGTSKKDLELIVSEYGIGKEALLQVNQVETFLTSTDANKELTITLEEYSQQIIFGMLPDFFSGIDLTARTLCLIKDNGKVWHLKAIDYKLSSSWGDTLHFFSKDDIIVLAKYNNYFVKIKPNIEKYTSVDISNNWDGTDEMNSFMHYCAIIGGIAIRQYCIGAENFNSILSSDLTPEHKKQLNAFAILLFSKLEINICQSKATTDFKSVKNTQLAYLNWANGNFDEALKYFQANITANPAYKKYNWLAEVWKECDYKDYLLNSFHPHYIEGKEVGIGTGKYFPKVVLPEEKEMIKKIKNLK